MKFQKEMFLGGWSTRGGGGGVGLGGQGGCERRIEVVVEIQKKYFFFFFGGGGVGSGVCQGEVFVKIQKTKNNRGEGVRVDVYGEVKFL